jgi:hypothetical protein
MEASAGPVTGFANNVAAVIAALEKAGVEFIDENGGGAGVRFRKAPRLKTFKEKGHRWTWKRRPPPHLRRFGFFAVLSMRASWTLICGTDLLSFVIQGKQAHR